MNNVEGKKSYEEFLEIVFPLKSVFLRKEHPFYHNLIKYLALRVAYVLYRLSISANTIDFVAIGLAFFAIIAFYQSVKSMDFFMLLYGYLLFSMALFIDFIDGSLARIESAPSRVGECLDDLTPNIIRISSFLIIGLVTGSLYFGVLALLVVIIVNKYVFDTKEALLPRRKWLLYLFATGTSLNGIRLLVAVILPLTVAMYIFNPELGRVVAQGIVAMYFLLSLLWIHYSLEIDSSLDD